MKTVDVLLYDGVDELDFCAPFEILASCRRMIDGKWSDKPAFHVETVAEHRSTITSAHGLCLLPEKALAQAREADIVIVPGGPAAQRENIPLHILEFLKKANDTAEVIASVCTGAFILAKAGLTDGYEVATHFARADDLARMYPKTKVMKGYRVVVSGKNRCLMTSAGISAGVDLALAMIERFEGKPTAQFAARRLEWPGK